MVDSNDKILFYRYCSSYDTFSFARYKDAIRHNQIHSAVGEKIQWVNLKKRLEPADYEYLLEWYQDSGEELNENDIVDWSFVDDIYMVYYPGWLFTHMNEFIPEELLLKYGPIKYLEADDAYYEIKANSLVPLIGELKSLGYDVRPATELEYDP